MWRSRLHRVLLVASVLIAIPSARPANGQSLSARLLQESPDKLVIQSRESGNIVRGAILFHQGNINCVKCHRPNAEKDRIGPELSRIGKEVTDVSLVESILLPSKTIKQGYETTNLVTVNGRVINGIVVGQDQHSVTLRSGQAIDTLLTIQRTDIEIMQPGTVSNMPESLVNELKDRQQFLDLLRYVLDLKERGPSDLSVGANPMIHRRESSDELKGMAIVQHWNCAACHSLPIDLSMVPAKQAPDLRWSAKRLNPTSMVRMIADPQQTKPGTSMPHLLGHLSSDERQSAAQSIVQFLIAIDGNQYQASAEPLASRESIDRGNELFHSIGCVACHAPRNESAIEQQVPDSIPLGDLSQKYDSNSLTEFLENPHAVRPSGRMPEMQLIHREALDLSDYLLQSQASDLNTQLKWTADRTLAAHGRTLFQELKCDRCHTGVIDDAASLPIHLTVNTNHLDKGCLSGNSGRWPDFRFVEQDRQFIRAALSRSDAKLSSSETIDLTLESFHCVACHERDGLGGVTPERNHFFQTTNLNLGEQGRIPPTLSNVGAKLNEKWMRDVMVNRRSIRPAMKTRMPQYGEQNIGHLIELFQKSDQLAATAFVEVSDRKEMRKLGLEIAGSNGLNCVACHTYQYKISDTMPAVDLTEMAERLKKDWFYQYMLAPQKFSANTVMPSFWPSGKAIRPDIVGDPHFQVEALWQYLLDGRQASSPRGVVREPLEIVVGDEARMLRRSYQGIGKRGMGVGYPTGVNLAFDVEQMRLAMIWKGRFVDPSGVWYGQGHGTVRPMGSPINFAKGPDLDDRLEPWLVDDGRPPGHIFQGYVLDAERRPTFRYRLDETLVEDFAKEFNDENDQPQLRRQVTIATPSARDGWRLRIASGGEITTNSAQLFRVDKQLTVRIRSDHHAKVVEHETGQSVYIDLILAAGEPQTVIVEYLWSDR